MPLSEKFDCGLINDDPSAYVPGAKKSWDAEEDEGFETVTIRPGLTSKIYSSLTREEKNKNIQLLRELYNMLDHIYDRTNHFLTSVSDAQLRACIEAYRQDDHKRYPENPHVPISTQFVRDGFMLFLSTKHTLQQLIPTERHFQAVNKPRNLKRDPNANFQGQDQRLRAYHRHIVIRLPGPNDNYTKCLLIHELAHTPPNHVCFREDDHKEDFRIFQWFFLNMAQYGGFITQKVYV